MFLGSRSRLRAAVIAAAVGAGVLAAATPAAAAPAAGTRSYLVITAPGDTAGAKTAVSGNGGTVWSSFDAIGVVVAHSSAADFAAKMRATAGVQKVGATRTSDVPAEAANPPVPTSPSQATPATGEPVRADMSQIGADRAWAVNTGSSSVTVGVLDTGVDDLHADLAPNFDSANSASCAYGKLDTRTGSWRDTGSHGTHVAGTIAAAKNGRGMVGVAPGVKVASVRIAEKPSGLFFPENTICAMVFSGDRGFEVTNNSYYTDPWLFNCPDNADQDAILEGVKRAVAYAEGKGVLNVAAAGNENYNLANKSSDSSSPNDSTPATRTVTNSCLSVPTEVSGVVSVASINSSNAKSSFSNFGTDKIHVAAPGDSVYSTIPGGRYTTMSGTSMASPHVAGVAALLKSTNPTATPAQLRALLATQADDLSCTDSRCSGTTAKNNFFGEGRVDAFAAVDTGTTPPGGGSFENTNDVAIPDAGAAVSSSITVSGITGNAPATLKVDVNIVHTYRGDLVIDLIAPDGTAYRLKASNNDSADNVVATYTVNASSEVANGTWKLQVQDVARQDTGYINSWKLTF
ncbi:S8 family serine peptidase [Lentzea sp. HUAS12]|uniref:S8 family peptidase n=1 Tax=Lentzea sp. HUAS12 TaxID=2951806 RepID=UPI00209ED2FC|nr:S8 family serine peptidase [Lentzea sp. HUAS12]USX56103.1 S8 family serine peptidase [Lentzea sp. HUAS12]